MRILSGWKTKLGSLFMLIAGGLEIGQHWEPRVESIGIGLFMIGFAIAFNGIYNRFCRVFYQQTERGNPDMRRSKIKKVQVS